MIKMFCFTVVVGGFAGRISCYRELYSATACCKRWSGTRVLDG